MDNTSLIDSIINISKDAGNSILKIYRTYFEVTVTYSTLTGNKETR